MTNPAHDPMYDPPLSAVALRLFGCLERHGGAMRLRPLFLELRVEPLDFVEAALDLRERYWIRYVWRKLPPGAPEEEWNFGDVDHFVVTRFGRRKYRATRPAY